MNYRNANLAECTVQGCAGKPTRRTLCNTHYQRWRKHGDPAAVVRGQAPSIVPYVDDAMRARFASSWVETADGCWEWSRSRTEKRGGYGQFVAPMGTGASQRLGAHRASWQIHHGEIPADMFVCHRCDNPPCVNPDHLFLGSNLENQRDMVAKGRWGRRKNREGVAT